MSEGQRTRTLDDSTRASDPGQIAVCHEKLRKLRPDLYGFSGFCKSLLGMLSGEGPDRVYIEEQLRCGDSRAAVVMSTAPLLVAAYTDELDCVAILRFPGELVQQYRLAIGMKLLTVNCYRRTAAYDADLICGPNMIQNWTGFHPLIADFLTDDHVRLTARKRGIPETEWRRAFAMGKQYIEPPSDGVPRRPTSLRIHPGRRPVGNMTTGQAERWRSSFSKRRLSKTLIQPHRPHTRVSFPTQTRTADR